MSAARHGRELGVAFIEIENHQQSPAHRAPGNYQNWRFFTVRNFQLRVRTQLIFPSESNQLLAKEPQRAMRIGVTQAMLQSRIQESVLVLGIGQLTLPSKRVEFLAATAANCLNQVLIAVAREILERRQFPVFLAHELKGGEGRRKFNYRCL